MCGGTEQKREKTQTHKQQCGDCWEEVGWGEVRWGEAEEGRGGINGDRQRPDLGW